MLVYLLLGLNIIGLLANGLNAWLAAKPTKDHHPKRILERRLIIVGTGLAILLAVITGCDWGARHFSIQPVINPLIGGQEFAPMPGCTVSQVAIRPQEQFKSLHMTLFFPKAIHSHRVLVERPHVNFGTLIAFPCDISAKESEPDPLLTFTVSTNQHEVFVSGHDLTTADMRSLLFTFYPDPKYGPRNDQSVDSDCEATYLAYGRELPARCEWKPLPYPAD